MKGKIITIILGVFLMGLASFVSIAMFQRLDSDGKAGIVMGVCFGLIGGAGLRLVTDVIYDTISKMRRKQ